MASQNIPQKKRPILLYVIIGIVIIVIIIFIVLYAKSRSHHGTTGTTGTVTTTSISAPTFAYLNTPSPNEYIFTWYPVTGASCYNLYYADASSPTGPPVIPTVSSPHFTTCGLGVTGDVGTTGVSGASGPIIGITLTSAFPSGNYRFAVAGVTTTGAVGPLSTNFDGDIFTTPIIPTSQPFYIRDSYFASVNGGMFSFLGYDGALMATPLAAGTTPGTNQNYQWLYTANGMLQNVGQTGMCMGTTPIGSVQGTVGVLIQCNELNSLTFDLDPTTCRLSAFLGDQPTPFSLGINSDNQMDSAVTYYEIGATGVAANLQTTSEWQAFTWEYMPIGATGATGAFCMTNHMTFP